jgi:NAD(P)-dependent dehydrogenase (short-subunit alcohol dehydrogenase family)
VRLDDRVAVVTEGAQGLGQQICLTLASAGASIVITCRPGGASPEPVPETIRSDGGRCSAVLADVSAAGQAEELMEKALSAFARFGVRVNAVAPGVVETKLMERVLGKGRKRLLDRIPLRRSADPKEVADVVLFLASDRSSYITGEIIRVAGGMGLASG